MARLIVETRPGPCPLGFSGDTGDLVWFLSFAAVEQFGSQHELSRAAFLLRHKHKVRLRHLLNFAAADDDAEELEHAWQPAAGLAEAATAAHTAMTSGDAEIETSIAEFPGLPVRMAELAAIAKWAAEQDGQVRLTYVL
jgi:hypothetical protein